MDLDKDYCSKHQDELAQCSVCGAGTLTPVFTQDGTEWRTLCEACSQRLATCAFCKQANICDFETNPSPLPKMIQQQIRQGNMITVGTIKNPDRIRQTCQNGCPCYDPNFECMRQFNYCERMNHVYADPANEPGDSDEIHSEIHE